MIDSMSGARFKRGEKLTPDAVRAIRAALAAGDKPKDVAARSGISLVMLHYIRTRRRWASIP